MLKNMTRIRKWQVLTSIIFCLITNSLNMHAQTRDVVYNGAFLCDYMLKNYQNTLFFVIFYIFLS